MVLFSKKIKYLYLTANITGTATFVCALDNKLAHVGAPVHKDWLLNILFHLLDTLALNLPDSICWIRCLPIGIALAIAIHWLLKTSYHFIQPNLIKRTSPGKEWDYNKAYPNQNSIQDHLACLLAVSSDKESSLPEKLTQYGTS